MRTMQAIRIRQAAADDLERLFPLFMDMERHYDGEAAAEAALVRERLGRALASDEDGAGTRIFLAAFDGEGGGGEALGFACLFRMFPGGQVEPMWYLKELYVAGAARGRQVGEALMRAAAEAVLARGGSRLEFTTDAANEGARRFYRRLGAAEVPKIVFRFDREALAALGRKPS